MNKLRRKFQQWRALKPWERHLFASLFFLLPATWIALRVFGFNRTRGMAESEISARHSKHELPDLEFAQRCAELTAMAARNGLYQANCLHQSLALCRVLRRHGLAVKLKIGVLPRARPFQAHAWVELDAMPLGKQSVVKYKTFVKPTENLDKANFI